MRRPTRDVVLLEQDAPAARAVEAAEDVDEGRLAGPVRPDQADDLPGGQLERDVTQRLDAGERARDQGGPERWPGPPSLLCIRRQALRVRAVRDLLRADQALLDRRVVVDLDDAVLPAEDRVQLLR